MGKICVDASMASTVNEVPTAHADEGPPRVTG